MGRRFRYRKQRRFDFTGVISSKTSDGIYAIVKLDAPFRYGGWDYKFAVLNDHTGGRASLITMDHFRIGDKVKGTGVRGVEALLATHVDPVDYDESRPPIEAKKPWWKWPWW